MSKISFNDYQQACTRTANPDQSYRDKQLNWALGIAGEAGEYCELIKKNLFHKKAYTSDEAEKELGDILYYVAMAAHVNGISLEEVAMANVEKLLKRYPDGFVDGGGIRE